MADQILLVGANADLFRSDANETILCGPAGTGKTIACLWRMHHDLLKYPGSRGLIARKTRVSLTQSGLVSYEEKVLHPGSTIKDGPGRANRHVYQYPNGSCLVVQGLDMPTRLFSTEFDLIYVQECNELLEEDWESLIRAMRSNKMPRQLIIGDCNPDHPNHWIKSRSKKQLRLLSGNHSDNPHFTSPHTGERTEAGKSYLSKLENLTGVRRERLLLGHWAAAEGVVYEDFSESVHLIYRTNFVIPADWRRIVSIDFGYVNPFTAQWWAIDGDGRMYLYREVYGTNRITSDWANEIKRLTSDERIEAFIADHDAEDRATLKEQGIYTVRAYKDIKRGIEAVSKRFRIQGDGKPRIYLLRDSLVNVDQNLLDSRHPTCLADELTAYSWPIGIGNKPSREVPAPGPDHGCDAMRYAVAYLDLRRTAGVC